MKQLFSVILAAVLVTAVSGTMVSGTMAGFFDTEVSTDNKMCAGTRLLEVSGGPITVECGAPCKWYSEEFTLINVGTLEGEAVFHIPREDDCVDSLCWSGLECVEDGTKDGKVWNGSTYLDGTPVGAGVASSEPELGAEEGGYVGGLYVNGFGTDAGDQNGPPEWIMSNYTEIKVWFDDNGDGDFDDAGELIVYDMLNNVACTEYTLGIVPPVPEVVSEKKGGGWGSYFDYTIGAPLMKLPLIVGQNTSAGWVNVWTDGGFLYVEYAATDSGWEMDITQVYVDTIPPPKMSPGLFDYKHEPVTSPKDYDLYQIPILPAWTGKVYIAAHAEGSDGETGWGMGISRQFKIELHLVLVEDPAWTAGGVDYDQDGDIDGDDAQKRWWPTNVFQGDKCMFDMLFRFRNGDDCNCDCNPNWWEIFDGFQDGDSNLSMILNFTRDYQNPVWWQSAGTNQCDNCYFDMLFRFNQHFSGWGWQW